MDNQILNNPSKSIWGKKLVFGILGAILLTELIWAVRMVYFSSAMINPSTPKVETPTVVSLASQVEQVKVGEDFIVDINISSEELTDGTDLIITYDPTLLMLPDPATPVAVGSLYDNYPANTVDNTGKITVSGISENSAGVIPNGLFGSVNFRVKNTGQGQAKIAIEFTKGETNDSNITQTGTGKDILEKVEDLEIKILP